MNKKIFLIGSMGSGKSTIGRLLAKKLNLPHYDLDTMIEKQQETTISEIFQTYNEEYFRDLESKALAKYSMLEKFVISTGGGTVLREENQKIFKIGFVVYLSISLDAQYHRIKNRTHRPLIENKDIKTTIKNLDDIRGKIYQKVSNVEVDVSNLDKEDVISNIINKLH